MLGIGAVLTQKDDDGKEYVIAYASRSNNDAEAKYSSYEGECLAVVWAVAHFHPYLYGQSFTLVTDHQPLKWLMESDKLTGKLARWALLLQEYDFQVVHKAGLQNLDADGLSRNPSPLEEDLTGARWHGTSDQEAVPGWHASSYLAWMEGKSGQAMSENVENDADGDSDQRGPQVTTDVWKDQGVLYRLQHGQFLHDTTPQERDRIVHRMARFHWEGGLVFRRWPDGSRRVVPRPDQRLQLVRQVHEDLGHFGVRRTHSMLQGQYWWMGMQQEVATYVGRCEVCDRVRSNFNTLSPQLQPLPIMGLGYRWSLDFVGPLMTTSRGVKYVLVMVEHFSKWIELVALPQNSSELAAAAFLDRVLARFGAPTEVLTDQGREFLGSFEELCTKALIDHCTTSRDHPEADGLAERVVQTVKRGLRKYGLLEGNHRDWDLKLLWIAMGYRFSRQASLASYSPYQLLYGREPV
jgi:transposase InsO family protein